MPNLSQHLELSRCPHCGVNAPNLFRKHVFETTSLIGRNQTWGIYVCKRCGNVVSARADRGNEAITGMFPAVKGVDANIPSPASVYLSQAIESIHAPAGAIMLAASAVDAMLKEKGYVNGSLFKRIDEAAASHLITAEMAEWAHDIRLDANDQRHADMVAPLPSEDDAAKSVEFALALAEFLFVLPARIQRGLANAQPNS